MKKIYRNIGHLLTLEIAAQQGGRKIQEACLSIKKKAALIVENNKIVWLGSDKNLPKTLIRSKHQEIDLDQRTVLPGLVECHTHLVFAGSRAEEFELRNQGMSYQEIAARGGGILSTMRATRQADEAHLVAAAVQRLKKFSEQGVTTVEAKSGYALDLKNELKCLRAAKIAGKISKVRVVSTFLGAHAVPPEFSSSEDYLSFLKGKVLPQVKKLGLAERVDIFVEKGFFFREQGADYLSAAKAMGFDLVVHADQLSLSGGSQLAANLGAKSADHVLQVDDESIQKLAKSSTVPVLLPTADLYMKTIYPPARKLIDAGAGVALATDFNPGSSPTQDVALVGLLARLEMKMTLPEVIVAYTFNAARALGLEDKVGSLSVGKTADLSIWDQEWTDLFYSAGSMRKATVRY